jgi:hypothetical protein
MKETGGSACLLEQENFFIIVLKPQGRLLQGKAPTEAKTNNLLYKKMCRNWKSLHEHLVMKAFH